MSSANLDVLSVPWVFYSQRAKELRLALNEVLKRQGFYRAGFIILGLVVCLMLYQSFVAKRLPLWTPILVVPLGLYLGKLSKRCQKQSLRLFRLADYYDRGIARLSYEWGSLDEGQDFIDQDHFYATDLDLFGHGSLFQLICSARTQAGRETLANWMKKSASREEVQARHAAISELRGRCDLREALASTGTMEISNCWPETFRAWVASSPTSFPWWGPLLAPFLALAVITLPALYGFGLLDLQNLWLGMGAIVASEILFAGIFLRRVRSVLESTDLLSIELPIVSEILRIVDREHFSSAKLVALAGRMREGGSHVGHLQRLISLQKERDNPYFTLLSYFLLWGTQFAMAIDQWRRLHGVQMLEWLAALGELEALTSLSAYAYEHPLDTFPELLDQGPVMNAEGLGHPLLKESTSVRNDFQLGEDVKFFIVSGSNMSGKSTFLRAVGLNAVLAWMGGPVRCTKFSVSPLGVMAAVRVQDSVVDGRSHFLTEMQRLRRMIDVANEGPLLYLADEIMSCTNSKDRRIATAWVVRALVLRGAVGVITTHDLALTEIASGLPGSNVHFEDTGESGNLTFDYKLRPGLLTHSNALNIAHMLGIDAAALDRSAPLDGPAGRPQRRSDA